MKKDLKKLISTFTKLTFFVALAAQTPAQSTAWSAERGVGGPFDGSWQGTGQAVMKPDSSQAKVRNCSDIGFEFGQESGHFKIVSGYYDCEDLKASYGSADFEVRGNSLWYQGQDIGTISNEQLEISVPDPNDGTTFRLTLASRDGDLDYLEEWVSQDNTVLLRLQGTLSRVRHPNAR
jgi:hypothetical protein